LENNNGFKKLNQILSEMKHNAIASGSGIKDFNEGPNTMSIFD
jgi:hypothetical protein